MSRMTPIDRVRSVLEELGKDLPLKEVVDLCPELTWHQVFLAIDHLSREGQVQVFLEARGTYMVRTYLSDTTAR